MSKGLPCVGCLDCPGVNDLIRNEENGLLVRPTPDAFATALSHLMNDHTLRVKLGTQARKDISEYTPEKIWSSWTDLIEEVINNHK